MTISISGVSAPRLFRESLYKMRIYGNEEETRNGPVYSIQEPVILNLWNPTKRVITDPTRNANPFFHVMEFIWMMAGSNDIQWLSQFNKQMLAYSDDGRTQHAAYGHRWRAHFMTDQIHTAIQMLVKNRSDRRIVIGMWDPAEDLNSSSKDVPCNTQIYLRVVNNCLDMTVTNRSNDLIWGALGANIVHMTFLQELIANATGIPCGEYRVFTNNLHMYKNVPNFEYYDGGAYDDRDIYNTEVKRHVPLVQPHELYQDLVEDCENVLAGYVSGVKTFWMRHVGSAVHRAWILRDAKTLGEIKDDAWRIACTEWVDRKSAAVGNQQLDNYSRVATREQESTGMESRLIQSAAMADVGTCQPDVGTDSTQSGSNCDVSP